MYRFLAAEGHGMLRERDRQGRGVQETEAEAEGQRDCSLNI